MGDDTPIWSKRQLAQSVGQAVTVFLTGLAAHGALSTLTWDHVFAAGIQAVLAALGILGLSQIGKSA